jgi:hypothetical protein
MPECSYVNYILLHPAIPIISPMNVFLGLPLPLRPLNLPSITLIMKGLSFPHYPP